MANFTRRIIGKERELARSDGRSGLMGETLRVHRFRWKIRHASDLLEVTVTTYQFGIELPRRGQHQSVGHGKTVLEAQISGAQRDLLIDRHDVRPLHR